LDPINYPLSSFAVCADPNAGARAAAREKHREKNFAFKSNSTKYWNKETSYVRGIETAATGYSRTSSDIYEQALNIQGQGRKLQEQAATQYGATQFVDEGGSSRTAGRNQYLALLNKQSAIESKINNTFGRTAAKAKVGAARQYQNAISTNREKLGLPPEYGAPIMMPPRDTMGMMMNAVNFGMGIVSAFKSDIRLKENVEQVDTSPDGYKIYEFNYKEDPTNTRYRGAMAQDVAKINPMAVGIRDNHLTVDYSKIDVDMEVVY
jgi:hypothetical protein